MLYLLFLFINYLSYKMNKFLTIYSATLKRTKYSHFKIVLQNTCSQAHMSVRKRKLARGKRKRETCHILYVNYMFIDTYC